jgi:hypothetical protein
MVLPRFQNSSPLDLYHVESPSVTVIRNAAKEGIANIQSLKITSSLDGVALVLVPPFIAKVLLDLPSLACDKVFTAVLEAIGNLDRATKTTPPSPASQPTTTEPPTDTPTQEPTQPGGELPKDPIDEDEGKFVEHPPTTEDTPPSMDDNPPPRASKKPSIFARCGRLIKYLYMAQFQQLNKAILTANMIPVVSMQPTMEELSHKEWTIICHIQARVNQSVAPNTPSSSPTDPTHLFDKVATPLNDIQSCLASLAEKVGSASNLASSHTNPQKLKKKFEAPLVEMFLRLSSTDGKHPALQPQPFLVKFLTAKGTGVTPP